MEMDDGGTRQNLDRGFALADGCGRADGVFRAQHCNEKLDDVIKWAELELEGTLRV